ncbi:MAG TPA: DUF6629 family protein [Actinomycetota bacterium]|nr:DUF6629 family protein [Actinomycetota bacterium]
MCFSPQADLVGGIAIGAIGVDTVRHCRHRRELALAAIPLLLGAHQLVEAFVWWGAEGSVPHALGRLATWAYLLFAFCVLPVLVPAAVMAIEPTNHRRWAMVPFLGIGVAVSVVLLIALVTGPFSAVAASYHVEYTITLSAGTWVVALYVVATCGSLLVSGYRHVTMFGAVNLVAAIVIAYLLVNGFASVWCAWAAVASGAIALHLRYAQHHRGHRRVQPAPA